MVFFKIIEEKGDSIFWGGFIFFGNEWLEATCFRIFAENFRWHPKVSSLFPPMFHDRELLRAGGSWLDSGYHWSVSLGRSHRPTDIYFQRRQSAWRHFGARQLQKKARACVFKSSRTLCLVVPFLSGTQHWPLQLFFFLSWWWIFFSKNLSEVIYIIKVIECV